VGFGTARLTKRGFADPRRPRWRVLALELPAWWLWGAGILMLLLSLPALLVAAVALPLGLHVWPVVPRALYAVALLVSGWAVWARRYWVVTRHVDVEIAGLPSAFDGYRIAQLSDLHVGSVDDRRRALAWVRRANAVGADLIVVTGDLVTSGTQYYEDAAAALAHLRAPDGVMAVMGNHDQWDGPRLVRLLREAGLVVLQNECRSIARDGASLTVAGIDDPYAGRPNLTMTLSSAPAAAVTLLLSHYPDFFEEARARGVQLTLSGHTHGGQVGVPFLSRQLSLATLSRQRARGLFLEGGSWLYVNAGLGTTGPPVRLGIPPEIAVIVLRRGGSTGPAKWVR
jgi:hypothetical protein